MKGKPVPTKEEMIDALVKSMEDWDWDSVLSWAQYQRRSLLEKASLQVITNEYNVEVQPPEETST